MRAIPNRRKDVINLANQALVGVQKHAASLDIRQNTAERIAPEIHNVIGEPGPDAAVSGKCAELAVKRDILHGARIERDLAITVARKLCGNIIDLLKLHLGRVWSPLWNGVGLTDRSLAVPKREPLHLLTKLRNYLREHPERENESLGVTAIAADQAATALETALHAVNVARSRRAATSSDCDAALRKLRKRLTALRGELDLLLEGDDARWADFGFSAPGDRRRPEPVKELVVEESLPGQALVKWERSARATNYRVTWTPQSGGDQAPRPLGLFADPTALLRELPIGVKVRIEVTARNERGETRPAKIEFVSTRASASALA